MPTFFYDVIVNSLLGILQWIKQSFMRLLADFEAVE
jgi:hypothetical protein